MRYFDAFLALSSFGLGVKWAVDGEFGWAMAMFAMAVFLAWTAQSARQPVVPPSEDVTSTQETFLARGYEPVETPTGEGTWSDADWWQKHLRDCPGCRERY